MATIRAVPSLDEMLFSDAVHHLRSAVDNIVFHMAEQEHGRALAPKQERLVAMLIYVSPDKYDEAVKRLTRGKNALSMFDPTAALGGRLASLQPFEGSSSLGSLSPILSMDMRLRPRGRSR